MNLRKKIVITGGLGHIGSGLFKEINKYFPNFTIYLIDDLSSNNFQSLYNLSKKIKLYFFNKNIIDINSISLLQKIKKIDYVIHTRRLMQLIVSNILENYTKIIIKALSKL